MAKQLPNYYSCAKCGFRGVGKPEHHTCKVAAPEPLADLRSQNAPKALARDASDEFGLEQAERLSYDASSFMQRAVTVSVQRSSYQIVQICGGCRCELASTVLPRDSYFATLTLVGAEARRKRLLHQCAAFVAPLEALDTADLAALYEQLERDSENLAKRAIEVKAALDARLAANV